MRNATRLFPPSPLPLFLAVLALAFASPAGAASAGADAPETARFQHICAAAIGAAERLNTIPAKLLTAISHAESGRWDAQAQATIAWPWTVTAEGTGHYLPSRAAAIAKVEALRARGIGNIDVGCMQVNLHYHPDAFDNLDAAFDPATNAAYAGRFLAALKRETGSWTAAAARYHSATREFAEPYRAKVMRLWRAARAGAPPDVMAPDGIAAPDTTIAVAATPSPEELERKQAADAHRRSVIAAYLAARAVRRAARAAQLVAAAE